MVNHKKILLLGGGGHAGEIIDTVMKSEQYNEIGIIDNNIKEKFGIKVVGSDSDLETLFSSGWRYAFVAIGSVGNPAVRIKLFKLLTEIGFEIPTIVDSTATVSKFATIEAGVYISKKAVVNTNAVIKKGAIINTASVIEHDSQIGEFAHISPGTIICGCCCVGNYSHVGANSCVIQQINIGSNCIVGAGSVVVKNIRDNTVSFGNPCREVRENENICNS